MQLKNFTDESGAYQGWPEDGVELANEFILSSPFYRPVGSCGGLVGEGCGGEGREGSKDLQVTQES